jgi:hypothetical protein
MGHGTGRKFKRDGILLCFTIPVKISEDKPVSGLSVPEYFHFYGLDT